MDKIFVDWEDYLKRLDAIVANTKPLVRSRQVIVGLTRGGLVPAVYLSHALDVPMIAFDPHLLHSDGAEREPIRLPISPAVIKEVLIVDDIADTGKTFSKCTKFFGNRGFNCTTISVFINRRTTNFEPDYPGEDSQKKWVVFPYEKE